ncbi:uncharacterized protein DUF262 [Dysgonomonas alginatilytica]|uniref:Uncharacterized protein DUF262 n=1 Tax=Dysgonomonas alginatilytica TaxID=1605892 RepID=A0A2V3PSZ0_9BACT|nr:DUF262 domain-containing protein [Dysgonomonas alginatilytica]PXV66929.1 uncharacterized protein DUF262 [Dysgonomonas alginatilytica]
MSLSLSAEQKNIKNIFLNEDQYVIPSYQRPYSWEYDQCFQLYNDLMEAFEENTDYFIGNIIIAKSTNNKGILQVVDGQQRIITLFLFLKVLSILYPEMKILKKMLEIESWEGDDSFSRIRSEIFESSDGNDLDKIFKYQNDDFEEKRKKVSDKQGWILERLCDNRIEANSLFFYGWLVDFQRSVGLDKSKEFIKFLLENVYLLPIELVGNSIDEANTKALVIFETINNRGMNLEDADIFKAKLYNKAKRKEEEDSFIRLWVDFKASCDALQLKVDDVFRYYSHIIRGTEGITTGEKNLREFFINKSYSPLSFKDYQDVLSDLFKITEILEYLNQEKIKTTDTAIWLQLIDAYTNQYPKYAIVNFLYVYGFKEDRKFIDFLKSIVRYIYYQGSTTTVKFEIYNIIKQTSSKTDIDSYKRSEIPIDYFLYLGRLKKGFALLAFYLENHINIPSYTIDRIITTKDKHLLSEDWENVDLNNVVESLGNFVVLDIPKRNLPFDKKSEYYIKSHIDNVRALLNNNNFTYHDFINRDNHLKNILLSFFSK